jgi:hypothetical protein
MAIAPRLIAALLSGGNSRAVTERLPTSARP